MITNERIIQEAKELGCEPEMLWAVDQVESKGNGFLSVGKPKILFEPHIFWKELRKQNIDPKKFQAKNSDILYPIWGTKPYGKESQQYGRLERAMKINAPAALMSCSWGRYQIMGFNWKLCGCLTVNQFVERMKRSEDDHLDLFTEYVKKVQLDDELRERDFEGFARGYNGPLYIKNNYANKLSAAYKYAKKELLFL